MIEAITFDVGGVLVPSPLEHFTAVDTEHGLPAGTTMSLFRGGDTFARCEVGDLPLADFSTACAARIHRALGITVPTDRFDRMLRSVMGGDIRPEMLELVQQVKTAGYRTAVLTNIVTELRGWLHGLLPAGLIDVYADSSELGMRKPDQAVYDRLLELLDFPAESVAFVDDFAENLEPAEAMGMTTVLFQSPEQAREELIAAGVRLSPTHTREGEVPA